MEDTFNMEPYPALWSKEAETVEEPVSGPRFAATVTPGTDGIHNGTVKWLRFLDASVNGLSANQHAQEIVSRFGPVGPEKGQPVEVAVHYPEHLSAAVETVAQSANARTPTPEMQRVGSAIGRGELPPPPGIAPHMIRSSTQHYAQWQALLAPALRQVMKGALFGTGSNMIGGLGGGQPQQPQPDPQMMQQGQQPRDWTALARTADLETPSSNPVIHDEPGTPDGDTQQFNDGSTSPAFQNPNLNGEAGGSQLGEDNVMQQPAMQDMQHAFAPDSTGVERADLMLPLLMHYYHSDESGANDPLIRSLHEILEHEKPGYLDHPDHPDEQSSVERLFHELRQPPSVHAKVANPMIGQMPSTGPNNFQAAPQVPGVPAQTPGQMGQDPGQMGGGMGGGQCPYCGGVTTADGSCPQCGAKANPMGGAMPPNAQPGTTPNPSMPFVGKTAAPGDMAPPTAGPPPDPTAGGDPSMGAPPDPAAMGGGGGADPNQQGPVSDEQKQAVAELLLAQGRSDEIPMMIAQPYNYDKEMAQIAQRGTRPPSIDPSQQAQPMPPMPPGGGPPMGGGAPPEMQMAAAVAKARKQAADSIAPRCPNCNSATTGLINEDGDSRCHACGNIFSAPVTKDNITSRVRFAGPEPLDAQLEGNPVAQPAADQEQPRDVEQEQDSSLTWQDANGQPLQANQEYELHNPTFKIPDIVRVESVKPDGVDVTLIGQYANQAGGDELSAPVHISKEEHDMEGLSFVPLDGGQGPGDSQASQPLDQQVPPTTGAPEGGQREPALSHVGASADVDEDQYEEEDGRCPKCSHTHVASSMSSPETEYHECYRCGNAWETRASSFERESSVDLSWLNESNDDFFEGFERAKAMREAGLGSRSLHDVAARDTRLQEIRERLEANAEARTAGKKFTPSEQREFINERGSARNADLLALEDTHYKLRDTYNPKANGLNVPDAHLFMGV
jgi:ssDNA-binding Zn-finger/Zn-ribbon topoisomerase 1